MSTSKACHIAQFSRTSFYRKTRAKDQSALRLGSARSPMPGPDSATNVLTSCFVGRACQ